MKFLIILEPTETGFSAYCPDLDGCVAAGGDVEETIALMQEAIGFHLEGLAAEGLPVPIPQSKAKRPRSRSLLRPMISSQPWK